MKRRLVALGLVLLASSAALVGAQSLQNVPRITIDEVKTLMARKQVVLIDVRDSQSFSEGHIPGAINVPFDHLPNHVDEWKMEKRLLVTYCA
jgi:rhodanese-related sulfurtransferase